MCHNPAAAVIVLELTNQLLNRKIMVRFKNSWGKGGKYYQKNALHGNVLEKENETFFGGEVTNSSDTSWLISGASNSNERDFIWLPPNTNSDGLETVKQLLAGDVDAVWPAGMPLRNRDTGEVVTSGAFKLRDHRNTNIIGSETDRYEIYDFSEYFTQDNLPSGWRLPQRYRR